MCGIFGVVKGKSTDTIKYLELTLELGRLSEERGRHSAGLAFYDGMSTTVHKKLVRFSQLPITEHITHFSSSSVVIGHTRFATQGSAHDIKNASPLALEGLVGTHNGDIDKKSVPDYKTHEKAAESRTDTEILYRELGKLNPTSSEFIDTLESVQGRLALAFISSRLPDKLLLTRGAISPLSYAYTEDGSLAYASNPNWFRIIEATTQGRIKFSKISILPEGSLIAVSLDSAEVQNIGSFTPTCRETDLYYVNSSAYKNFPKSDKDAFNKLSNRLIAAAPKPAKPLLPIVVEGYKDVAPQRGFYEDGMLFDDLFLEGKTNKAITEEPEERVSLDHIEKLCEAFGSFNEDMYSYFLESDSEEELETRYTEVILEAFNSGNLSKESFDTLGIPAPLGAVFSD